jgi:hypothetical protein
MDMKELESIFIRHGLKEEFEVQRPLFIWREVVGESISRITLPLIVRDGVIQVMVESPVVSHELNLLKEKYIKRINERLGEERIVDIRFRIGRLRPKERKLKPDEVSLSQSDYEEIESIVAGVEDKKLRDSLRGLIIAAWKLRKVRNEN